MEFFCLVKETESEFSLIDTDPYVIGLHLSQAIERGEGYRGDSFLHRSLETKYLVVQVKNKNPAEGLKTQLSSHSSWLENQSLQQCYKFMSRVGCICHIKRKLCCCSCAWMVHLAFWKIRKVLLKISYACKIIYENISSTYTLERSPECQKGKRRMMAFIMIIWKGRKIRPGLDTLILIWRSYTCLEVPEREGDGKTEGGRTKLLVEKNLFLCIRWVNLDRKLSRTVEGA